MCSLPVSSWSDVTRFGIVQPKVSLLCRAAATISWNRWNIDIVGLLHDTRWLNSSHHLSPQANRV